MFPCSVCMKENIEIKAASDLRHLLNVYKSFVYKQVSYLFINLPVYNVYKLPICSS